ncbi:hypothetical protein ACPX19_01350 [Winogradskyella sp. HB-48]|uniref:hypothetical protein n=1 Tax=Winogradskyella sp. HB-48 TaxID=3416808 RepID=UPI003CE77C20
MKKSHIILFGFLVVLLLGCSNENQTELEETKSKNLRTSSIDEDSYKLWLEVGKLENNKSVLTINKSKLINNLNKNFTKINGVNPNVEEVSLVEIDNSFYLIFKGKKTSISFYVQESKYGRGLIVAQGTSCTTDECSQEQLGCIPYYPDNDPGHEGIGSCTPCSNGGKCKKTVTNLTVLE